MAADSATGPPSRARSLNSQRRRQTHLRSSKASWADIRLTNESGDPEDGPSTVRHVLRRVDRVLQVRVGPIHRATAAEGRRRPPHASDPIVLLRPGHRLRPPCERLLAHRLWNCPTIPRSPAEKIAALARHLDQSRQVPPGSAFPLRTSRAWNSLDIRRNMTREDYLGAVQRIKGLYPRWRRLPGELLAPFRAAFRGQTRFSCSTGKTASTPAATPPISMPATSRSSAPRPRCSSRSATGVIQTKPIKGTRPRIDASDPQTSRLNDRAVQRPPDERKGAGGAEHDHRPGAQRRGANLQAGDPPRHPAQDD